MAEPDPKDLRIEIYRNYGVNGEGDRSVAVRITHIPTGHQGVGEHQTSGLEAKATAMRELLSKLEGQGGGDDE